jgi:hypothetical protein
VRNKKYRDDKTKHDFKKEQGKHEETKFIYREQNTSKEQEN